MLGISLNTHETLLKYIGGLHTDLHHTIMLLKPSDLDEVCVQATYLDGKGKFVSEGKQKMAAKFSGSEEEKQKNKDKGKAKTTSTVQQEKPEKQVEVCSHCKFKGHNEKQCWKLHLELRPKKGQNKKQAAVTTVELSDDSHVDKKLTCMALQGSSSKVREEK